MFNKSTLMALVFGILGAAIYSKFIAGKVPVIG